MARVHAPPRDLYEKLLARGVSREEIEAVYRKLRASGYGAQDLRKRMEASLLAGAKSSAGSGNQPHNDRRARGTEAEASDEHRRMGDFFPIVAPALRREVNRWARKEGLLITGPLERWRDFVSIFRRRVPDLVNPRLTEALARRNHYLSTNPYGYSLATTFEALYQTSRSLLGRSAMRTDSERAVGEALSRRDPFALEYLRRFAHYDDMLRRNLAYLELALDSGKQIDVDALARVTRELYRLTLSTERVSLGRVDAVLSAAGESLRETGKTPPIGTSDAAAIFRICLENLQRFKRELHPVMVRAIGEFHEYDESSLLLRTRTLSFLGLSEEDILTVKRFHEQESERRERVLAEQQRMELENLERQKDAGYTKRFNGVSSVLDTLFPESGIGELEQRPYLLPYFDTRVFVSALCFDAVGHTAEAIGRDDPLQMLLVVHRIVDNMLSAVDGSRLERLVMKDRVADTLATLKDEWATVYSDLFEPYQRAVASYAAGVRNAVPGTSFSSTNAARGLEQEIILLRNQAIRNYGHAAGRRPGRPRTMLWDTVGRLSDLLDDVGADINSDLPDRKDAVGRRIYSNLKTTPFLNFALHTAAGSIEFKPVVRQVQRYLEARHHAPVESIPRLSQLFFFDLFRGVLGAYLFLVSDERSFLRSAGRTVFVAGETERETWKEERSGNQGARDRLQIRLDEQMFGSFTDTLTGLRSKDFFLQKLPQRYEEVSAKQAVSVLMVDIDHFKWINDGLGHQKGDEILREAASVLLDGVRRANDLAIRYGGEELMVVTVAPLHAAVALAERLRYTQAEAVSSTPLYAPIAAISEEQGEPCGTFSIGVTQADGGEPLDAVVDRADKALYLSKKTRNSVSVAHRDSSDTRLESYTDFAVRVQALAEDQVRAERQKT